MSISSDKIWLDGQFVPFKDANIHILTHTLHYGLGAFEGIRCYQRANGDLAIFRLEEHIDRLHQSCKIATIELPWSTPDIMQACIETIKINKFSDCYLRPLAFLGDGEMGLSARTNRTRLAIAAWQWGAYLGEKGLRHGIRAKVSSYMRHHINATSCKGKICGNYVNNIFAKREAINAGYDEAIMLDTEGFVSEASGENLFAVYKDQVHTTPIGSAILEGITRHTVITLLEEAGYNIQETRFTRDMLYIADEIFCCGTAAEITPVTELDDRKIGAGKPGPVTQKVQELYFNQVKGDATNHPEWFSWVK